jgi:hypothetical protein
VQTPTSLIEHRDGELLCWVAPVLTLYLPYAPDRSMASAVLEAYRDVCPEDRRTHVAGTRSPGFARLADHAGQKILSDHLDLMNRRRDAALCIWDGRASETWTLHITGSGVRRGRRQASFCQVIFPNATPPEVMFDLAVVMAEQLPFLSGHCGYSCLFDAAFKAKAFDQIYAWAKLYSGLDVEDLNVTLSHVLDAIKGASWLTLLGTLLLQTLEERIGAARFGPDVYVSPLTNGMLLRADPEPRLGDRSTPEALQRVIQVERALSSIKLTEHAAFEGRFAEEGATLAWLQRFLKPDGW